MYKLITFDATGTLLSLKSPVGQIYSSCAKQLGIVSDSSKIEKGFKQAWISMSKEFPNFGLATIGWHAWWSEIVMRSFIEAHDAGLFSKTDLKPVAEKLIDIFRSNEGWDLSVGSLQVLDHIKAEGVTIGVISNYDPRLHEVLKSLKIEKYFDFVLTSYEAKVMKPNREIFQMAEVKMGLQSGKCCLHVGDNPNFDYLGALGAGWNAALISKEANKILQLHPTIDKKNIFGSLSEFTDYI